MVVLGGVGVSYERGTPVSPAPENCHGPGSTTPRHSRPLLIPMALKMIPQLIAMDPYI